MAGKILSAGEATRISQEARSNGKKIILAGGCFDILHKGHILFLEHAKKQGDLLFLLLESDENVRKRKGKKRPLNSQQNRAIVLCGVKFVDYVIPLNGVTKDKDYDKLIVQIRPDIIAMTASDPAIEYRKKQSKMVGAKVVIVIKRIKDESTTHLAKNI